MTRIDDSSTEEPHGYGDDALHCALHDVTVPEGLDDRLLEAVQNSRPIWQSLSTSLRPLDETGQRPQRTSRRRWISLAAAATVGGMLAAGTYIWDRRELRADTILAEVRESLAKPDWRGWNHIDSSTTLAGMPLPRELRVPRGWQYRSIELHDSCLACNMTLPGCPAAVLFVIRTRRDLSDFPVGAPPLPQYSTTGTWDKFAIWHSPDGDFLYVLAMQGVPRDYLRLFPSGSVPNIA